VRKSRVQDDSDSFQSDDSGFVKASPRPNVDFKFEPRMIGTNGERASRVEEDGGRKKPMRGCYRTDCDALMCDEDPHITH
jgi:hypothetical protein